MNNNELILEGDIYSGDTIDVITGDPEVLVEGDISSSDELSGDATVGVFQGKPGKDGISPTVSVEEIEGGNRVNITDKDGTKSFDVMNGVGGEGGGVTSWNDLIDKPFEEILPAFDITWDGDMAGRGTFSFEENIYFVKVSDEVYTKEQLLNSTMYYSDGRYDTPIEEDIFVSNDGGFIAIGEVLVVFSAETFIGAMGLPEGSVSNGVWFFNWTGEEPCYVKRFIASSTIKKLDSKYLDLEGYAKTEDLEGYTKTEDLEGYAKTEDLSAVAKSGSWNDLEDKPFGDEIGWTHYDMTGANDFPNITRRVDGITYQKVSEHPYLAENPRMDGLLIGSLLKYIPNFYDPADDTGECIVDSSHIREVSDIMSGDCLIIDNKVLIHYKEGTMAGIPGIYIASKYDSSHSTAMVIYREVVSFSTQTKVTVPLNEKYIPDTIARKTDIPDIPGGTISWNNLTDKPFGEGAPEWKGMVSGNVSPVGTDERTYSILNLRFLPTVGKRYKIEVVDGFGFVKASHIDTCISLSSATLDIGTTSDQVYYRYEMIMAGVGLGTITFVAKSDTDFTATIYEEVETIKTLNEKYIPDSIARTSDIPSLDGYATEEFVQEEISKIPSGGGTGNAPAIIDVTELPTENINEQAFYRKLTGTFMFGREMTNTTTCYCVNGLPEVGEPCTDADMITMVVYYNTEDGAAYGYVDDMLSGAMGVPAGWYDAGILISAVGYEYGGIITNVKDAQEDDVCRLLLEYTIYSYKDEWNKFESVAKPGEGYSSVVLSTAASASGSYSFASGRGIATGDFATALGWGTAEGDSSLAVGEASALGDCSFAIGYGTTTASGVGSFAQTYQGGASGSYSFARGTEAGAGGSHSFAQGAQVHASSDFQFVYGKANIIDDENKYIHIVGNGKASIGANDGYHSPSNAHTLDWNGNAWFAGDIYIGGTGQDDPNAKTIIQAVLDALPIYNGEVEEI